MTTSRARFVPLFALPLFAALGAGCAAPAADDETEPSAAPEEPTATSADELSIGGTTCASSIGSVWIASYDFIGVPFWVSCIRATRLTIRWCVQRKGSTGWYDYRCNGTVATVSGGPFTPFRPPNDGDLVSGAPRGYYRGRIIVNGVVSYTRNTVYSSGTWAL